MKSIEEICTEWANMASMHPIVGEGKTDSEVKLMWDRSASTYSDSMYSEIIGQMIDMLLTKGIISSDRTVLDIECGIGSFTRPLSRHAKNIISMDSSKTMLSVLERNCEKESISGVFMLWEKSVLSPNGLGLNENIEPKRAGKSNNLY